MLRIARCATRRGSSVATAVANIMFVAIALLVVTVGVLATESRMPNPGQDPLSQHTAKSSRMAECGGDELAPVQTDDTRPASPVIPAEAAIHYCPLPIELPLPELVGFPQAHGLRAPPHI